MLCQTSFIVRALSPLSLDYAFRHLRLLIDLRGGEIQLNTCSFFSDDCILHMLCLSLLRAAAARTSSTLSPFFVAFPESNTTISVVYPASRKMEMEHTVQHIVTSFPEIKVDCMADDEFGCGLAMENALLSGLAAALICDGWIVFEDNFAVQGGSTNWIDGTPTEAITFAVHTEVNDCIDFVLSPDVILFRHFKIERFLMGPLRRLFDGGAVAILDNHLENMSPDDIQELKCLTIPSLKEGVVSGFCKSAPKDYNLDKRKEIWTTKHGLVLSGEEFYIRVSFPCEENMQGLWFPSCLVLRNCGLIPALPNIRATKVPSILQKAMSSISRWDFFNSGKLELKSILQNGTQNFCWTTANLTLQTSQIRLNDSNFDLGLTSTVSNFDSKVLQNFRRPKLPPSHYAGSESIEPSISDKHGVDDSRTSGHSIYSIKPSIPTKLGVPVFLKRKIRDLQIPGALKAEGELNFEKENIKNCMEQGKSSSKRPQGSKSKSIVDDTVLILPKQKRVCAEQEKNTNKKLQIPKTKSIVGQSSEGSRLSKNQKDHNAQKVATSAGEKKSSRGEKKTIDAETNHKKVLSKHAAGKLSDLTVPELKGFLSENKAKISGKKEELIQRVILLLSSLKPPFSDK